MSTNWNLKFQRGKTEGPYPTGEMALGFFPPRLLFSVLIKSWSSLPRAPHGGCRRKGRSEWSGESPGEDRHQVPWGSWAPAGCLSACTHLGTGPGPLRLWGAGAVSGTSPGLQNSEVLLGTPGVGPQGEGGPPSSRARRFTRQPLLCLRVVPPL